MGNLVNSLKKFFKNKNTITILGVIVVIGVLYFGYTSQINSRTEPVTVFVAREKIEPRTRITEDMIEQIKVPKSGVSNNVVRIRNLIVGKYTNYNTVIPAGSMFYTDVLINEEDLPDSAFVKVKEGDVVYNFSVNMNSTYGNSIFPGNKIDIYMKATNETGDLMVGKLLENIEVLAVKDSSGRNVFESTSDNRTPSMIIFGLEPSLNILLRKASYMSGVELFPVPQGGTVENNGETQVSSQQLQTYINANSVPNDEITDPVEKPEVDEDTEEE